MALRTPTRTSEHPTDEDNAKQEENYVQLGAVLGDLIAQPVQEFQLVINHVHSDPTKISIA
jgi:hypothetical protein